MPCTPSANPEARGPEEVTTAELLRQGNADGPTQYAILRLAQAIDQLKRENTDA